MRPGEILASRYRLTVLLHDRNGGRFWRAHDLVLARDVALHVIAADDARSPLLQEAARRSATVQDRRLLRVLDSDDRDGLSFVVNEWGEGTSLNHMVADEPLAPIRAAWIVAEVAGMVAAGHRAGVAHGRLVPENVLLDTTGSVKVIGFAVDAALHGLPAGRASADLTDLGGLLYCALTGRWTGVSESGVEAAPLEHGRPLRPRQVRAGVPRVLDSICESLLGSGGRFETAEEVAQALLEYVGDPTVIAEAEAERLRGEGAGPRQVTWHDAPLAGQGSTGNDPAEAEMTQAIAFPNTADAHASAESDAEATQVGVPAFGIDVEDAALADPDWHTPSDEVPTPPPPFEEAPERPLFAPDPPEGRLRRLPPATSAESGYWPFGSTGELPVTPAAAAPRRRVADVPGRIWLRAAMVLLALLVLLPVAYVVAGLLQDDGDASRGAGSGGPSSSPVTPLTVTAFDPPPGDAQEHDDEAKLAADGDAATSWTTSGYQQNLGPSGIKPGVGLLVDLGDVRTIRSVSVTVGSGDHAVSLLDGGSTAPSSSSGLDKLADARGTGTIELDPSAELETRYLVIWLTELPKDGALFRGSIVEVEVGA